MEVWAKAFIYTSLDTIAVTSYTLEDSRRPTKSLVHFPLSCHRRLEN